MTCMHWKLIAANCLIFSSLLVAPLATRAANAQSITQSNSIHAAITSAAPTDANFLQWANDIDGQYIAWAEQSPTDSVHSQWVTNLDSIFSQWTGHSGHPDDVFELWIAEVDAAFLSWKQ